MLFGLSIAFLLVATALGVAYGYKVNDNVLYHTINTLKFDYGMDSWKPMKKALEYWVENGHASNIYTELLIKRNLKFQYPPTVLLIPETLAALRINDELFYGLTTVLSLLGTILSVTAIALRSLKDCGGTSLSRREKALFVVLIGLLTLTFYPVIKAAALGQIQVWLNALFAVALLCYAAGRRVLAGAILGIMASVKPQYGLFVLWGIIRADKRFVLAMLSTTALGLLIGVVRFGLPMYLDYLRGLQFLSLHGEAFYANQSFNGLANRFFSIRYPHLYNNIKWRWYYFPPYNPWVYYFTLVTSVIILTICLARGRNRAREGQSADFCLMALGVTMASPIAWEHHYGVLLPIFAFLWPLFWLDERFSGNTLWRALFVAGYLLSSNFIPALNRLAPTLLNVLQSYLFFAAVIVFLLLWRVRQAPRPESG